MGCVGARIKVRHQKKPARSLTASHNTSTQPNDSSRLPHETNSQPQGMTSTSIANQQNSATTLIKASSPSHSQPGHSTLQSEPDSELKKHSQTLKNEIITFLNLDYATKWHQIFNLNPQSNANRIIFSTLNKIALLYHANKPLLTSIVTFYQLFTDEDPAGIALLKKEGVDLVLAYLAAIQQSSPLFAAIDRINEALLSHETIAFADMIQKLYLFSTKKKHEKIIIENLNWWLKEPKYSILLFDLNFYHNILTILQIINIPQQEQIKIRSRIKAIETIPIWAINNKSELLGKGIYGQVYPLKGIPNYAAKIVSGYRNLLRKEFKILQQLHHPNILPIFFFSEQTVKDTYGIVMPCGQMNLHEYYKPHLGKTAPLLKPFISCAIGITSALAYIHDKKFIHGDIKLSNFVLFPANNESKYAVKFIDFGLAEKFNNLGYIFNSQLFRPPELPTDEHMNLHEKTIKASPSIDIWAIGMVLLILYAKTLPSRPLLYKTFAAIALNPQTLQSGQANHQYAPTDSDIYHALIRCWDRKPTARINAQELHTVITCNNTSTNNTSPSLGGGGGGSKHPCRI